MKRVYGSFGMDSLGLVSSLDSFLYAGDIPERDAEKSQDTAVDICLVCVPVGNDSRVPFS